MKKPQPKHHQFSFMAPEGLYKKVQTWQRAAQRREGSYVSLAEAIRRLLDRGLNAGPS